MARLFTDYVTQQYAGAAQQQLIDWCAPAGKQAPVGVQFNVVWRQYDVNVAPLDGTGFKRFGVSLDLNPSVGRLDQIKGVYIDNTDVTYALWLKCNDTGHIVTVAAGQIGFFPLLTSQPLFTLYAAGINISTVSVTRLIFTNVAVPAEAFAKTDATSNVLPLLQSGGDPAPLRMHTLIFKKKLDLLVTTTNPSVDGTVLNFPIDAPWNINAALTQFEIRNVKLDVINNDYTGATRGVSIGFGSDAYEGYLIGRCNVGPYQQLRKQNVLEITEAECTIFNMDASQTGVVQTKLAVRAMPAVTFTLTVELTVVYGAYRQYSLPRG